MINYPFKNKNIKYVIGIDEVGWGAIAGPITVGGCCVSIEELLDNLDIKDSKKYTEIGIEKAMLSLSLLPVIPDLDYYSWSSFVERNDTPITALSRAQNIVVRVLSTYRSSDDIGILVDGNLKTEASIKNFGIKNAEVVYVPKGDSLYKVISVASVVAKYDRDTLMREYHNSGYPEYNFHKNKGYLTKEHNELIKQYGYCDIHRYKKELINENKI